jgi:hypothetical protein
MRGPDVSAGDDGIVVVDYGSLGVLAAEDVRAELMARRALGGGGQVVLMRLPGIWRVEVDAARFVSSPEYLAATRAVGAVTQSSLGLVAVRVFELYHPPPFPFRVFGRDTEAKSWLRQFLPARGAAGA